jgi:ribonuclease VapC
MIRGEPERERFANAILDAPRAAVSAGNYLETAIAVDRERDPISSAKLNGILHQLAIEIAPVTEAQAHIARQAYRDFGKGSGHPARLNFGDCFAYAVAVERGEPLLYKGDDFAHAGLARMV